MNKPKRERNQLRISPKSVRFMTAMRKKGLNDSNDEEDLIPLIAVPPRTIQVENHTKTPLERMENVPPAISARVKTTGHLIAPTRNPETAQKLIKLLQFRTSKPPRMTRKKTTSWSSPYHFRSMARSRDYLSTSCSSYCE
jgi:hypothetical protein